MSEKEKMLSGMLYFSSDEELVSDRGKCKEMCKKLNDMNVLEYSKKEDVIRNIFGSVGENPVIEPHFWCDYGYNITAGDNLYINHGCVILDCAKVCIGNNVMFGPNCGIYTAGHPLDKKSRLEGLEYAKGITIGNDVWIGGGVVILPGVTIGDNVVIGAGSVVTKNVPSNVVAVGNPCKILKEISN